MQRDEEDPEKRAKLYYSKLPPNIHEKTVMLVDPMVTNIVFIVSSVFVFHFKKVAGFVQNWKNKNS